MTEFEADDRTCSTPDCNEARDPGREYCARCDERRAFREQTNTWRKRREQGR